MESFSNACLSLLKAETIGDIHASYWETDGFITRKDGLLLGMKLDIALPQEPERPQTIHLVAPDLSSDAAGKACAVRAGVLFLMMEKENAHS